MKLRVVKGICVLATVLMLGSSLTAFAKDTESLESGEITETEQIGETAVAVDEEEIEEEGETEADISTAATTYMNYDLSSSSTAAGKYECVVELKNSSATYTYTTKAIKPAVKVSYIYHSTDAEIKKGAAETKKVTVSSSLYKVTYKNNINAGTASIVVTGVNDGLTSSKLATLNKTKNTATGKKVLKFKINPAAISKATLTLSKTTYGFTGEACKPKVVLVYKSTTLKQNTDYKVSYKNNVNAGTATATVKATGSNFTGSTSKKFSIKIKAPTLVVTPKTYAKIRLDWSKIANVTGYEIYRKTTDETSYTKLATVTPDTKLAYNDTKAKYGVTYCYKVRAIQIVDSKQTNGKCSAVKKAAVKSIETPTATSAVYVSDTTCKVRWTKVDGADGYEVDKGSSKTGTFYVANTLTSGTTVAKTVSNLKSGKKYYFKVRAYRLNGTTKVFTGFSAVVAETGMPITLSSNINATERLAYLFPDGVPTTQAQMKKYLKDITVNVINKSGKKSTMTLTVHKKLASSIVKVFNDMVSIKFPVSDAGAYCWRAVNNGSGSGNRSHHSYGCCVDINVDANPMISSSGKNVTGGKYSPGTNPYSVTEDCVAVWAKYGFGWGGAWKNSKDYMHFSYTNC